MLTTSSTTCFMHFCSGCCFRTMTNAARQETQRLSHAGPGCEGPPIKKEPEEACSILAPGVAQQDQAIRHAPKRHLEELRMKIVHRRRAKGQSEVPDDPTPLTHEVRHL